MTAFGAAANLVHPATGYSIARSLREAPALAREMATILRRRLPARQTARLVWTALWPAEKRRQVSAHPTPKLLPCVPLYPVFTVNQLGAVLQREGDVKGYKPFQAVVGALGGLACDDRSRCPRRNNGRPPSSITTLPHYGPQT